MSDKYLGDRRNPFCSGVSRRDFVRAGALGAFGLTLPGLLGGKARAAAGPASRAKSVLLVFLGGGLSHLDTFDVKPHAPQEFRGKYKPIPTNITGLHVGELLPRMARTMDKVCLVRSQSHENECHQTATNWVLSGRFGSPFGDHPSMGSVVAHRSGFAGALPPYVAIPRNPTFMWELGKSAWLDDRCESFKTGNPQNRDFCVRDARGAFNVDGERSELRDRYGRSEFGQGCLLARRLIERGVRFAQVDFGGWDHHANIWDGLGKRVPEFDAGFSTLIQDMYDRGLLQETLVVCMSEFGRAPMINADGGRDHWARAGSILFAGAGVQGGSVVGATDKKGAFVTDRPCSPADVAWTSYELHVSHQAKDSPSSLRRRIHLPGIALQHKHPATAFAMKPDPIKDHFRVAGLASPACTRTRSWPSRCPRATKTMRLWRQPTRTAAKNQSIQNDINPSLFITQLNVRTAGQAVSSDPRRLGTPGASQF
jgi:hypothetical protein